MTHPPPLPVKALQNRLILDRRSSVLMMQGHAHGCPDFVRHRLDGRPGWIDRTNLHTHPRDARTATRAITDTGDLLWLVDDPHDAGAFPAFSPDPSVAFAQAAAARRRRRDITARWPEATALRARILRGQTRVELRACDLHLARAPGWLIRFGPRALALAAHVYRPLTIALFAAHLRR